MAVMRSGKPTLKHLWQAFDETTFGHDRTLNLRESLPSASEARERAEAWLRMRQIMGPEEVLVITGRGNQSVDGVGVLKDAVLALLPSLRRRGVVSTWREHTAGSIVITPAPVSTLLGSPKRNRDGAGSRRQQDPPVPVSLSALESETISLLRELAVRTIETLGVVDAEPFVEEEMQRAFAKLSMTLPDRSDRETTLRRAITSAIDDLNS